MNSLQILEQVSAQALQGIETINYYGFPKTRSKQLDTRIKNLTQERLEVSVRAQKMGFTPLAIVPIKLLHAAFERFGLYWFEDINSTGEVPINIQSLKNRVISLGNRLKPYNIWFILIFALSLFYLVFYFYYIIVSKNFSYFTFGLFLIVGFIAVVSRHIVDLIEAVRTDKEEDKVNKFLMQISCLLPKKYLLKLIQKNNDDYHKIHLYFNFSLSTFKRSLELMCEYKLQPHIATVSKAVGISYKELRQVISGSYVFRLKEPRIWPKSKSDLLP